MSSRGAARRRISWELVDDADESDSDVYKLEESYIDDFFLIAEINNALIEFQWNAVVESCDKALAERPRWSEVRAARRCAASYLEAGGQPPPAPVFYVVVRGAFVKYNMNWGPRAANPETKMFDYVRLRGGGGDLPRLNVPRKSFLDVPDDALLLVMQCLSYPRCALLAATNKRLLALFKSRPLAARRAARRAWHLTVTAMRDNAKFNAKPARERGYVMRDGYSVVAKEELALIANEFPEALQARHLPPYAIKRTGAMSPNAWRYSRVFGKRPNEVYDAFYNYNRNPFAAAAAWHGSLPDEHLTPLELAVSYPKSDRVGGVVFALLDLGAKPTKLGLDIAHANCEMEFGCWTMQLLIHEPRLVSTTEYDLDYCAAQIDLELEDETLSTLVARIW